MNPTVIYDPMAEKYIHIGYIQSNPTTVSTVYRFVERVSAATIFPDDEAYSGKNAANDAIQMMWENNSPYYDEKLEIREVIVTLKE